MEPALSSRLVCIVPPSLLAIIGTAELFDNRFRFLFCLLRSICGPLLLLGLFLDTQYARQYRAIVAVQLFVVHKMMLWKDFEVPARIVFAALLLAVLRRFLPRERRRLMLHRVL